MDITIPIINYRVSLEVLILIGVIYLIMAIHTVCSCCNVQKLLTVTKEGLKTLGKEAITGKKPSISRKRASIEAFVGKKPSISRKRMSIEAFVGANTNYGESSPFDINNDDSINTDNWMQPNLSVVPGQSYSKGVREILDRPQQPIPLPEGEMLMFANTPFKPECCPNTYSNSSGCACMTTGQYNYLVTRGSNNVPYSEY